MRAIELPNGSVTVKAVVGVASDGQRNIGCIVCTAAALAAA